MPQTEQLCANGHRSNANGNCSTAGCIYRVIWNTSKFKSFQPATAYLLVMLQYRHAQAQ